MKLFLKKNINGTLEGVFEKDRLVIEKWPVDYEVEIETKRPRNYQFHKLFFAGLLPYIFANQNRFDNMEHMRKWITVSTGYCKTLITPDGKVVYDADSISFAKMDEISFDKFYNDVIDFCLKEHLLPQNYTIDQVKKYVNILIGFC